MLRRQLIVPGANPNLAIGSANRHQLVIAGNTLGRREAGDY